MTDTIRRLKASRRLRPSFAVSLMPILMLLASLIAIIAVKGASAVSDYSQIVLLGSSLFALILAAATSRPAPRELRLGLQRSARQILPAIPLLVFIATVSATWMLSGVVPTLIYYGLKWLNPDLFLITACAVCSVISVLTGSSWTTIATIGVALMGIGTAMGFSPGWVAGAIISGAYFGDKVSPLSDTTVMASSTCGVGLFDHIRYLMLTSAPAMIIALSVFGIAGWLNDSDTMARTVEIESALEATFSLSPWVLVIPAVTAVMIAMRVRTLITLIVSSAMGLAGIFLFQPHIFSAICGDGGGFAARASATIRILCSETSLSTGSELLDSLVQTGGIAGMAPTIALVTCAMVFGGVMMGTGMLAGITRHFTHYLQRRHSIVSATVGAGLFVNSCTADQYLSIIITGNMFRNVYRRFGLEPRLLSRTLEDSISVTSVIIPWNSCGVTQSTVLGVATLTYLPYCVFNYLSPVMSLLMAWTGIRIADAARGRLATAQKL